MGGKSWVQNLILTGGLFSVPLLCTVSFLNRVAAMKQCRPAVPVGTLCVMWAMWVLLAAPLTIIGGIIGRNTKVWALQAMCCS
jgi:hypothetical protein